MTQGLLLGFFGGVLARIALSDVYLRYVTSWMKWPLAVTGIVLAGLGLLLILRSALADPQDEAHGEHEAHAGPSEHGEHGVPAVTWLLIVPALVFFLVSPPPLGSYLAERRAGETVAAPAPDEVATISGTPDAPADLEVTEFVWRSQSQPESLAGQTVSLTGFVTVEDDSRWFVSEIRIGCCAADAQVFLVRVDGAPAPARDSWVRVTGVHQEGSGASGGRPPVLAATDVVQVEAPVDPYGG